MAFEIEGTILKQYIEEPGETEVTVPEGITMIGWRAFRWAKLTSVRLPESLEVIGEEAFAECDDLRTVHMPKQLKQLRERAFFSSGLESITIPKGILVIPSWCFADCLSLRKVGLPEGLEGVDNCAFQDCPIEELQLPSTVTFLGRKSLNALRIEELTLPEALESFDPASFSVEVRISAKNRHFTSFEGALYDKAFRKLLYLPASMLDMSIPKRVMELGEHIVGYGTDLTLTLPDRFTSIASRAFEGKFSHTPIETLRLQHPRCTVPLPLGFVMQRYPRYTEPLRRFLESRNLIMREKLLKESIRPPQLRLPLALYLMLTADSRVGQAIFQANPIDTLEPMLAEPPADVLIPLLERKLLPLAAVDDLIELAIGKGCQEAQLLLMQYKQEGGGYSDPADELRL